MFPVVSPPIVNVLFRRDCIDEDPEFRTIPAPDPPDCVVADRVAIGESDPATLVIANLEEEVAVEPTRISNVLLIGESVPFEVFSTHLD